MGMVRAIVLALAMGGCGEGTVRVDGGADMARPSVECGVELVQPFAYSSAKGDGVTCSHTKSGASYASVLGDLALVRIEGERVSFLSHVKDAAVWACNEWTGTIKTEPAPRWAFHLDMEGCGSQLVGVVFGDENAP
jgi:hypothetical protein